MKKITLPVTLLTLALVLGLAGIARADHIWFSYGEHKYALTETPGTWIANETEAISAGGHLVTINSAEEETWLREQFGTDKLWIGFNQPPGTPEIPESWVWSSGEPVTYTHWAQGEPNNMWDNGEDKAVMNWAADGAWNDLMNDSTELGGYGIIERNAVVPLPSAIILLGYGLAGLGAVGWRSRKV